MAPSDDVGAADHREPIEGKDEHKLEYIKMMITIAMDDIKHVTLYITVAFAVVIVFLTQIPIDRVLALPLWTRGLLCASLGALVLSALSFFRYVRQLHITRMKMARCLPSLDATTTRELWAGPSGVWQMRKKDYLFGLWFLGGGTVGVSAVLFYLFIFKTAAG